MDIFEHVAMDSFKHKLAFKFKCPTIQCTQKWSFPYKIFSVNVTEAADLVRFTEETLNGKLLFLCRMSTVVATCATLNDIVLSDTMYLVISPDC